MATLQQFRQARDQIRNTVLTKKYDRGLLNLLNDDGNPIEECLITFTQVSKDIHHNDNLSAKGKQASQAEILDQVTTDLAGIFKTELLEKQAHDLAADLTNRAAQTRAKYKPKNEVVDYLQTSEMRAYLLRLRDEKQAQHNKDMAQAHEHGQVSNDQQRAFVDPVGELFNNACLNYDESQEQLIRAITGAPAPIQLLDKQDVEAGLVTLERTISPEVAASADSARHRVELYGQITAMAGQIIGSPLTQNIQN